MFSTALCSPTRTALITGRNQHSAGFGVISEQSTGFPGYNSIIDGDKATIGRIQVAPAARTALITAAGTAHRQGAADRLRHVRQRRRRASPRRMRWPMLWLIALTAQSAAAAPLDTDTRRCLNAYNGALQQVSLHAGRSTWACVRGALRGDQGGLDACVAGDRGGAVAARQARVDGLFTVGLCGGDEPLQRGAAAGNAAHRQAAIDLAHDLFDAPLGSLAGGVQDRACLDSAVGQAVLDFSSLIRAHRQCVAQGLRQGSIVDEGTLAETCGARAQADASGRTAAILLRTAAATQAACAARATATLFPGLPFKCHAGPDALATCIERAAACRACLAVQASNWAPVPDGSSRCDEFDDGLNNQSCGEFPFQPGAHCQLGLDSRFLLASIGLPISLPIQGGVRIACSAPGADGRAACSCELTDRLTAVGGASLVIPAIGDVCLDPHDGCAEGVIDCDGGSAVDVDLAIDHNAGACTTHQECAASCAATCAGRGTGYHMVGAACEGLCRGGAGDGSSCNLDGQCPLGECVGSDPVGHGGVCNCSCRGEALGLPAGPGALSCQMGMQIRLELPTDGDCRDAGGIIYPPVCVALTTGNADALITDANNTPGSTLDQLGLGVPHGAAIACDDLAGGRAAGLKLVGSVAALDTTLGDIVNTIRAECE